MAFLDNSGDIILDAVLTDAGRRRLARGDGTFRIAKFALGDDEINYRLYNPNHASGSAYYDLEILQSPVLEAFTNQTSQMHHRLVTLSRNDILYMPIVEIFETTGTTRDTTTNAFMVAVNQTTEESSDITTRVGVIYGENTDSTNSTTVRLDQGVDANGTLAIAQLTGDLLETQYQIQIDNRFGTITNTSGSPLSVSYVDEDNIASYFVGRGSPIISLITDLSAAGSSINGRRGTRLDFRIKASLELNSSDTLFTRLGGTSTVGSTAVKHIDAVVRVTGVTTGFTVDVPVRFIKI